jgi:hypothetical protein
VSQSSFDRYIKLVNLHICKKRQPALSINREFVARLSEAILKNGQLEAIGAEPCEHGWAVTYKYHTFEAMRLAFRDKKDQVAWVRHRAYPQAADHLLDQWAENNKRDLDPVEVREKIILPLMKHYGKQNEVAKRLGISESWLSKIINYEDYIASRREEGSESEPTFPGKDSSDLSPVTPIQEHEFTSPLDSPHHAPASGSEGRTLHKAAPSSSLLTLDAGHGAVRESPREAASTAPTLSSQIEETRAEVKSIRSTLTRKSEVAKALRGEYRTLAWNLLDYCDSQDSGRWSGEVPVPKQRRGTLLRAKVMVDGKPYEVPFIEETASGWRVLYAGVITFVRAKDCVAILDAGKVSA